MDRLLLCMAIGLAIGSSAEFSLQSQSSEGEMAQLLLLFMTEGRGCDPWRQMKRRFCILACRDISISEFSESERQRSAQMTSGRNVQLDQDTPETSLTQASHTTISTSRRCLKFALQPLNQPDLPNLLMAFEYSGQVNLSSLGEASIEGKILEIESPNLDIARDILLLNGQQCRVVSSDGANQVAPDESFAFDDDLLDQLDG